MAYLRERQAFGAPLLANQHLQYELAELAAELDLQRHHNWAAVAKAYRGEDYHPRGHGREAAARPAWRAQGGRPGRAVPRRHGVRGGELWPARFYRDTRLWSIGGGADEVMLRTLARMNGMVGD